MEYCSFLEHVRETVQERRGIACRVLTTPVLKNNQSCRDMITILDRDENVAPAICMEPYYQQFLEGDTIEKISDQILQFHEIHKREGHYDISFYSDFARVRGRIVCKLINYEKNREMLRLIPHRRFLDLAVVYYYMLEDDTFGKADILVRNEHMEMWDSDLEELDDVAMSNTARLLPYECILISDMLRDSMGIELSEEEVQQIPMYVLTNTAKSFGAVTIIYDSILAALAERLGGDYYILPSSVHECMLVPDTERIRPEELREMVCEINEEYVAEEEILGDSVYRYCRERQKLVIT